MAPYSQWLPVTQLAASYITVDQSLSLSYYAIYSRRAAENLLKFYESVQPSFTLRQVMSAPVCWKVHMITWSLLSKGFTVWVQEGTGMYHCTNHAPPLSLSIFIAIFPGEPELAGFIEAKDGGSGGDNCSWSRAKLQSNSHHRQTNTQLFTRQMPFLSPSQRCQSTEGKISHSMDLLTPSSPGVFQLCLWPQIAPVCLGEGCHASHQPSDASTPKIYFF